MDFFKTEREKAETLPCGLKVLIGENVRGEPSVMIWKPKAKKPYCSYFFETKDQRDNFICKQAENIANHIERKEKAKKERQGTQEQVDSVKVGDIFNDTWGYDQTNQDFYQVIEKKGRHVIVREIGTKDVGNNQGHCMSATCVPVPNAFKGEPTKKLLQFSGGKPYINTNGHGWCDLWDGRPANYSWYA